MKSRTVPLVSFIGGSHAIDFAVDLFLPKDLRDMVRSYIEWLPFFREVKSLPGPHPYECHYCERASDFVYIGYGDNLSGYTDDDFRMYRCLQCEPQFFIRVFPDDHDLEMESCFMCDIKSDLKRCELSDDHLGLSSNFPRNAPYFYLCRDHFSDVSDLLSSQIRKSILPIAFLASEKSS